MNSLIKQEIALFCIFTKIQYIRKHKQPTATINTQQLRIPQDHCL